MNVQHPNYGQNYRLIRAALDLENFTVSELRSLTGATENTIYSFVNKLDQAGTDFLRSSPIASEGPGRPRKLYSLTETGAAYLRKRSREMALRFDESTRANMPAAKPDPVVWLGAVPEPDPRFAGAAPLIHPTVAYDLSEAALIPDETPSFLPHELEVKFVDKNVVTIRVPANANTASIHTEFSNGILKVTLNQCAAMPSAQVQRTQPQSAQWKQMSPRAQEVLRLLGQGYSQKEVAQRLNLSARTVEDYVHNLLLLAGRFNVASGSAKIATNLQAKFKHTADE
jgi:transposase